MTTGLFVVLEGGDASGKSTQATVLARALRDRGLVVCETFEPGATVAGAAIRELVLHSDEQLTAETEALLMAADRAQHVAEQIAPALGRGECVVSDRYLPSSLVYQGVVRGLGVDAVEAVNRAAVGAVEPDIVVVIDVPDAVARERAGDRSDRFEAEDDAFHAAVRDTYRTLAAERGWVLVDGVGAVDTVAARVWAIVEPRLAGLAT